MNYDLNEMLDLRRAGWSFSRLGEKYGKHYSTLMFQCRKHGVVPDAGAIILGRDEKQRKQVPLENLFVAPPKVMKYAAILDEEANARSGKKSYQKYFEDAVKRDKAVRHFYPHARPHSYFIIHRGKQEEVLDS